MKMLTATGSDEILGFSAFGAEASELMIAVQTAIIGGVPYTTLRNRIFTHPTAGEGLTVLLSNPPPRAIESCGSLTHEMLSMRPGLLR